MDYTEVLNIIESQSLPEIRRKKYIITFSKEIYNLIKFRHLHLSEYMLDNYDTLSTEKWSRVSLYAKLSVDTIRKYKDKLDWKSISQLQDMSDNFIDELSEYIEFKHLSKNWNYAPSLEILQKYINKNWDWDFLSANNSISDSTILALKHKFNWKIISHFRTITYELVYEAKEYIDWPIFYDNNLQVNHEQLFFYQDLSFRMRLEFVEGLLDYFRSRRQGNTTNNPNIEYTDILNYTDKCPICRSSCEEDPDFIKIKCNHIFHKSCILQWTKKSTSCPMCRIEL